MTIQRKTQPRIQSFNFQPGRVLAGRYVVQQRIGSGWEGEVYRVIEQRTGIPRAAKVFFPHRNEKDRAFQIYAKKLHNLRKCDFVIQYHHSLTIRHRGVQATCLISELVEGELLSRFVDRQPGKRLHPFEGLHLLYGLARGVEEIHRHNEYHGDLHDGNVLVNRRGIGFELKVLDFYHWGRITRETKRDDICDLIRLFYDAVGGKPAYKSQPPQVKDICKGLRRGLIVRKFPTITHLRAYLETFTW